MIEETMTRDISERPKRMKNRKLNSSRSNQAERRKKEEEKKKKAYLID